ncbi:MAG: hypothetical protein LBJ64_11295 [Deltaproteobacteria bacterium]|nr:hypothetical protein [Deltaproteobacteria bacterium]
MTVQEEKPGAERNLLKAWASGFALLAFLFALSSLAARLPIIGLCCLVVLLAAPMALVMSHAQAVRMVGLADKLKPGGRLAGFLGRRGLKNFFFMSVSLVMAFCLVVNLQTFSSPDWLILLLSWPVFLLVLTVVKQAMVKETVDWLVVPWSLAWTRALGPLFFLLVYSLVRSFLFSPEIYDDIRAAQTAQIIPFAGSGSNVLEYLSRWAVLLGGFRDYAFGKVFGLSALAWFGLTLFSTLTAFCALFNLYCLPFLSGKELVRTFSPPLPGGAAAAPAKDRLVFQLLGPFLAAGVLFCCLGQKAEDDFIGETAFQAQKVQQKTGQMLIKIGDEFFRPEIIGAVKLSRAELEKLARKTNADLEAAIDGIFDGYARNVDAYLDWYYSLSGEYGRLFTLLANEIEGFLAANLQNKLSEAVDLSELQKIVHNFNQAAAKLDLSSFKDKFRRMADPGATVLLTLSDDKLMAMSAPPAFIDLKQRLVIGGGGGLAVGWIAGTAVKRMVDRVAAKIVFRQAVRSAVKMAASRSVSYAGAAALFGAEGGLVGTSIFPGLGTAVGTVAGILVGVGAAAITDLAMIKLEEAVNRDDFKKEILQAIEVQRLETKIVFKIEVGSASD